jgi:hypothetical protein
MSWFSLTHAVLPTSMLLPMWVSLSWAVVMSALVLRLTYRFKFKFKLSMAALLGVLVLLPQLKLASYLALAFQTPSLVLFAWALWYWVDAVQLCKPRTTTPTSVAFLGVVLGWALVLDTLNYWPSFFNPQLYALGFESVGLWLVLVVTAAVLYWSLPSKRWALSAIAVLAVYVLLRLPTGNVWDALLDPFVWLALHVQLWRTWRASRNT